MAKVLLVEDDNNLREIYQARLLAEGYEIIAAQNGEEALVVAKQSKPNLIISDVMMPRISGFEMLDILRNTNELKHTKIIMLTALGQAEDQKRADSLGADRYLVKSQVTLEDIVNAARDLLQEDGAIEAPAAPAATPAAPAPVSVTPSSGDVAVAVEPQPVAVEPAPTPSAPASEPAAVSPAPAPVAAAPVTASPAPEPVSAPEPQAASAPTSESQQPAEPSPTPETQPVAVAVEPQPVAVEPAPTPSAPASEPAAVSPAPAPAADTPVSPGVNIEPTPAPATTAGDATPQSTVDTAAQSLQAEEDALQAQISSYANQPDVETPVPETPNTDAAEAADDSSNTATINEAVNELNQPVTPEPVLPPSVVNAEKAADATVIQPTATEPSTAPVVTGQAPVVAEQPVATPPAPAPAEAANPQGIAGKKVIQPINDINNTKPKIDELLIKENAKEPQPAPTPVVGTNAPEAPAQTDSSAPITPATPGQSFDPNTAL